MKKKKQKDLLNSVALLEKQRTNLSVGWANCYENITKQLDDMKPDVDENIKYMEYIASQLKSNIGTLQEKLEQMRQGQQAQMLLLVATRTHLDKINENNHTIYQNLNKMLTGIREVIETPELDDVPEHILDAMRSMKDSIIDDHASILEYINTVTPRIDHMRSAIKNQNDGLKKIEKLITNK